MGVFDFFSGGKPQTAGIDEARRRTLELLNRAKGFRDQPGPRQLATQQAYQRALARQQGQTAGQGGQGGAISQARTAQMIPILAQQEAEAEGSAVAADETAQFGLEQSALGQMSAIEQARYDAEERLRQERGAMRRDAVGGLLDVGTKVAGGGLF